MTKLSRSFVRERELIIVEAEVVGPANTTTARLVVDTGAAATTLVPELIEDVGYTQRDSFKKAKVHTAVGEEKATGFAWPSSACSA
jgi:predicted aspartyl protease